MGTLASDMPTAPSTSSSTSTPAAFATPLPSSSSPGALAAALLLAALAAAAFVLARRRRAAPRLIHILESASLGPKRALVVARLGDELLVLGASEGGVALLATRPAPLAHELGTPAPAADAAPSRAPDLLGWVRQLRRPGSARAAGAGFERALTESLEDAELRRKLAAGHAGSVR